MDRIIENAIIESVSISNADHGILTMFLVCRHSGGVQGFGGYQLYAPKSSNPDEAGLFIWRILETVGVSDVDSLENKVIRIDRDNIKIHAIGNAIENKWFNPSEELS